MYMYEICTKLSSVLTQDIQTDNSRLVPFPLGFRQTQTLKRHSSVRHSLIFLDYVRKRKATAKRSSSTEATACVFKSRARRHVNSPPLPRYPLSGLILSGLQIKPLISEPLICVHEAWCASPTRSPE